MPLPVYHLKHTVIMAGYISIWTCFYLLVHHSNNGEQHSTSADNGVARHAIFGATVEMIKTVLSISLFLSSHSLRDLQCFLFSRRMVSLVLRYIPVAVLYAIYNNLMFLNLKSINPSVYLVLSSSRLAMTSFAWQIIFKKSILPIRGVAIIFIILGILARDLLGQETGVSNSNNGGLIDHVAAGDTEHESEPFFFHSFGTILVFLQMSCSVLAGILNEKQLKSDNSSLYLQNVSLCIISIAINLIIASAAIINDNEFDYASEAKKISSSTSILIVLTLAAAGIMSSLVIRHLDSVTKGVASSSETVLTSLIEYFWFGHDFLAPEIVGISLVSAGSVLYSMPPRSSLMMGNTTNPSIRAVKRIRTKALIRVVMFICFITNVSMHYISLFHAQYDLEFEQFYAPKQSIVRSIEEPSTLTDSFPPCTKEAAHGPRPRGISKIQYNRTISSEEVLAFIVKELNNIDAPVSLMYGTMLHEYRNGTGPCVRKNVYDKDFDIAMFPEHFVHVVGMVDDIESKFGWRKDSFDEERLFMTLLPPGQKRVGKGFQIDIYGFEINYPRKGLIHFPWDVVTVAMDDFLPFVKHKPLPVEYGNSDGDLYYYMPFKVPCLLANLYGRDYMTPKKGHFIRQKAYGDPYCDDLELSVTQREELERQISVGGKANEVTYPQNQQEKIDKINGMNGIIACIRSREDVVSALELVQTFEELNAFSLGYTLELYHYSSISPFLIAKLEMWKGVEVVDIKSTSASSTSCVTDALSITSLIDVILIEPSTILLSLPTPPKQPLVKKRARNFQTPCQAASYRIGSITSMSLNIDNELKDYEQNECKFQLLISCESSIESSGLAKHDIIVGQDSYIGPLDSVGELYFSRDFLFVYLSITMDKVEWISKHHGIDKLVSIIVHQTLGAERKNFAKELSQPILRSLRRYRNWKTAILLDRPVGWVAYDGGLVPQNSANEGSFCSTFNSIEGALRSVRATSANEHRLMLNIDLIMSLDNVNVAMHDYMSPGPIKFEPVVCTTRVVR